MPEQTQIPLFPSRSTIEPLIPALAERMRAVLESGAYVLGDEVRSFEREFAAACDREHCVGVGNGTDAIVIALRALGVGPGDEVIVPEITFFATAEAVAAVGARPVFCDIDPETFCMTAATASERITDRTAALVPVHLFGNPAPMGELAELAASIDAALVADAAQAAGARADGRSAGAAGDVATYSFYPSKNLGGFGDGGAIVTDDADLADRMRRLRAHGAAKKGMHSEVGYNSRLDEIQAGALRVLLPHLGEWTGLRRASAAEYGRQGLGEFVAIPTETAGCESAYHLYVVLAEDRDRLVEGLRDAGVGSRPYYTVPMSQQPAFASLDSRGESPASERFSAHALALPMGTALSAADVAAVVEAAGTAVRAGR